MSSRSVNKIYTAFGELLKEKAFSDITVKELIWRCGLSRNTFYYHFNGMEDLLEKTVKIQVDKLFSQMDPGSSPEDSLAFSVKYALKNKDMILNVYNSSDRSMFVYGIKRLCRYSADNYFSIQNLADITPEEKCMVIRLLSAKYSGIILDWLDCAMSYDLLYELSHLRELEERYPILRGI